MTTPARILHTGQAIVDIVMEVDAVPEPGGDTYATRSEITAGGGFNVMAAAARDGAQVAYLGGIGDGPFAEIVAKALAAEGVQVLADRVRDQDTGHCVAIVDASAERTFLSAMGAEGGDNLPALQASEPRPGDIAYVTGYSLVLPENRAALMAWLPTLPSGVRVVFDPSPMVAEVPDDAFTLLRDRSWLWTLNAREADIVLRRVKAPAREDSTKKAAALAAALGRRVVLRAGADGAYLAEPGEPAVHVPGVPVTPVDTNGAGDAHTGVLMAHLARGGDLAPGVRRANVAAAVAVTRRGPATSPAASEIDAAARANSAAGV